ncbi:hypothetical protein Q7P37_002718 [Cladosporium fusiforme]
MLLGILARSLKKVISRKNLAFVLPKFGAHPIVVLPPSQVRELVRKPDDEVDLHIIHWEQLANAYTSRPEVYLHPIHLSVVKRQLTRKLPTFSDDLYREMASAFSSNWAADKKSTTKVPVYPSCIKIVSRAANRVLSGVELCRSPEFLTGSWQYTLALFTAAARINMLPQWLRPVAAPWLTSTTRKHFAQCLKAAEPVIKRRLAEVQNQKASGPPGITHWVIEESIERGRPVDLEPEIICRRILALNMVAIHTTSIAVTNTFLDLFHSPDAADFVRELRKECDTVLKSHNGQWTKDALNELVLVDSAIKESMRLSVRVVGMHRMVTAPNGVEFDGFHVPQGVRVAAPNHHIQRDPGVYHEAEKYNAFRYAAPGDNNDAGAYLQQKQSSLSMPGDNFLAWGHGRHACPGRFFAAHLMKIMLAHVLLKYNVEADGSKPKGLDRNEFPIPSVTATFDVRLR